MQKALAGKTRVKFPVPEKIKFATVDVETGRIPGEFSLEKIQVAVKEDVDLSPLPIEDTELEGETELLQETESNKDLSNP